MDILCKCVLLLCGYIYISREVKSIQCILHSVSNFSSFTPSFPQKEILDIIMLYLNFQISGSYFRVSSVAFLTKGISFDNEILLKPHYVKTLSLSVHSSRTFCIISSNTTELCMSYIVPYILGQTDAFKTP